MARVAARLLWATLPKLRGATLWLGELAEFSSRPPEVRRRQLAERLHAQIRYFGRRQDALPEWREALKVSDPDELWELWESFPILTKSDLMDRFDPRHIQSHVHLPGVISSTGGSTGEPTPYLHDGVMVRASSAASLFCRLAFGWRPGMPTVIVWGSERDIGRARTLRGRIGRYLRNDWVIDGYHLRDATVDAVLSKIRRLSPVAIYGFTSMLEFVARRVLDRGLGLPAGQVAAAWNGGEMLYPDQSAVFEQAFKVPLHNLYGGRELGAMAYQPAKGAPLSVLRPLVFVEIVDDQGRPVAPGETGRLIWTSTVCRGTPFLRYDIGDLGCYEADHVDESGISMIQELRGRQAGLLTLPNGKTIHCLYWNHLLKEFLEVHQFQVAVRAGGRHLELRLRGTGFSRDRDAELRRIVGRFLGGISLSIIWLENIPRTAQGKLEQVVCED